MKRICLVAAATLAVALAGSPAVATSPVPESVDALSVFTKKGEWTIYKDASRNTCLAERVGPDGNVMQMGIMPNQTEAYVGVFTTADLKIAPKQPIEIAVDGILFTGEARGLVSMGMAHQYHGGYVVSNSPTFIDAIANGRELVAFPKKNGAFIVDLTGTHRAIEEIGKCHEQQIN